VDTKVQKLYFNNNQAVILKHYCRFGYITKRHKKKKKKKESEAYLWQVS